MTPEFKPRAIRLVVGLGNPETRYARTYHNAGRIALRVLEAHGAAFGPHTAFFTPSSYMNESGRAVARALRTSPTTLLLVHDDADLPLGTYRLGFGRGAGGHHGVESVVRALGTKEFWRLRIGVRPPAMKGAKAGAPRLPAGRFVLRPMSKTAEAAVYKAVENFLATLQKQA